MLSNNTPNTVGTGNDGGIMFRTNNGSTTGTPSPKLVIAQDGNIGIGTTSPTTHLEVNNGAIKVSGTSGLSQGPRLQVDT